MSEYPDPRYPSEETTSPEDMIAEGGAFQQPSTPSPGHVPLRERGEAALMQAKKKMRDCVHQCYDPHPFRTLLVAFGIGVVLGLCADWERD